MLKHSIKFCTPCSANLISTVLRHQMRFTSTAPKYKWDLLSGVCIERHPMISKPMTEIEEAYQGMLNEIEDENSMKSDHELRVEEETKQAALLQKGLAEIDPDKISVDRAGDLEDSGNAEFAAFQFAPRTTEADIKKDLKSLQRKLDKYLVLLIEQKVGGKNLWLPPQGLREEGETMRQAAERIIRNTCGEKLNIKIYGNAPIGLYKYVYPKPVRENGSYGAKIFYYLGKYMDGEILGTSQYQWLDREELKANLPKPIHKTVSQFLIPEENILMTVK